MTHRKRTTTITVASGLCFIIAILVFGAFLNEFLLTSDTTSLIVPFAIAFLFVLAGLSLQASSKGGGAVGVILAVGLCAVTTISTYSDFENNLTNAWSIPTMIILLSLSLALIVSILISWKNLK